MIQYLYLWLCNIKVWINIQPRRKEMETIIFALIIVAIAGGMIWYYNRDSQSLDINDDGKIDTKDAIAAGQKAVSGLAEDTRDLRDAALEAAVTAAQKTSKVVESTAKKTRATTKKVAAKPATKKTPAKPRSKK
jgi:hypothetical protein